MEKFLSGEMEDHIFWMIIDKVNSFKQVHQNATKYNIILLS